MNFIYYFSLFLFEFIADKLVADIALKDTYFYFVALLFCFQLFYSQAEFVLAGEHKHRLPRNRIQRTEIQGIAAMQVNRTAVGLGSVRVAN